MMIWPHTKVSWPLPYGFNLVEKEVRIAVPLVRSNFSATVCVFCCGLFGRYTASEDQVHDVLSMFMKVLVVSFAYGYVFEIANQTTSVAEDSINKPYRPIPAGLLTIQDAYWRWGISWVLFPFLIWFLSGIWAAAGFVSWQAWVFYCYVWPKFNNVLMRNMFSGLGAVFMFRILNSVLLEYIPSSDMSWKLDILMSLWVFATIHTQEFHDVEGDRQSNRKTIAVGLNPDEAFWLRLGTAVILSGSAVILLSYGVSLAAQKSSALGLYFFGAIQFLGGIVTSYRFIFLTSKVESENTYKMYYIPTSITLVVYLSYLNCYL